MTELEQIKETLSKMQAQIDMLEDRVYTINPQCYVTAASPECFAQNLSLSAAKSLWPLLENEFDRYCLDHEITVWTPEDNTQFYNEYIRCGRRLAYRSCS